MSKDMTNIMIVGVGGQGVLLSSEIVSLAAIKAGHDVKKSEVHGMAQRGGSVVSNVRFGSKVYSPLIARGEVDILLSFERLEALRWVNYLKEKGTIITNTQRIDPLTVGLGDEKYPEDILVKLKETGHKVVSVDALKIARDLGNQKVINTVLLGTLSNHLSIGEKEFKKALSEKVPSKTVEINLKAFSEGLTGGKSI